MILWLELTDLIFFIHVLTNPFDGVFLRIIMVRVKPSVGRSSGDHFRVYLA